MINHVAEMGNLRGGGGLVSLAKSALVVGLGAAILMLSAGRADAQYFQTYASPLSQRYNSPYTYRPPSVSPYINLIGRNPVVNYFGIVRPQLEARKIQVQQAQAIQGLNRQLQGAEAKSPEVWSLPKTGHTAYFNNFSHYYPTPSK
jgi:hypothetical protein